MKNKLVEIRPKNDGIYEVLHEDVIVGKILLNRFYNHVEMYFECFKAYRGNHYLSNALYLLTQYLHEEKEINDIYAWVTTENEMAIHILEHNGYFIEKEDNTHRYYHHKKYQTKETEPIENSLYLAGGCFWGMERVFKRLNGITDTLCGYVNGSMKNPSYEDIIRNETGYKEAIRIVYDPKKITLEKILKAYFICIDPTQTDGQGEDIGEQYQTGVYYTNPDQKKPLTDFFETEKEKYPEFYVELKPLKNFYEAEDYHQDYLSKHPSGYCHIGFIEMAEVNKLNEE